MNFNRLIVLLPGHSLEDLSLKREPAEADQLLAAWSALWHPSLLASAEMIPSWVSADSPPTEPAGHLIVVPACAEDRLPQDWLTNAQTAGAIVLRNLSTRDTVLQAALKHLNEGGRVDDAELTADFMALGVGQFWVEVLTRQLRYMSNLDETSLQHNAVRAATAAVKGDIQEARSELQNAYQLLHDAREYFYPVDAHLLDLTLVTPQTIGPALRAQLARPWPTNLLLTAEAVEAMANREPATLQALVEALNKGTASIIGGEYVESMLPLLDPEAISRRIAHGLKVYEQHLGRRPMVFGRRRFGLTPALPQILHKHGFTGGLHFTLDDGRFPVGNQSRVRWQGWDGTRLEMLARLPLDAGRSNTFLSVSERLGEILDLDHAATLVFAHWPGHDSPWYQDLLRVASYTNALGTFSTIPEYLSNTSASGQDAKHSADDYRSPYLRQWVESDQINAISRHTNYYRRRTAAQALASLTMLNASLSRVPSSGETLLNEVERSLDEASPPSDIDARIDASLQAEVARLYQLLGGSTSPGDGHVRVNPWTTSQTVRAESFAHGEPGPGNLVWPTGSIDVPGMGFAWIGPVAEEPKVSEPPRRWWWGAKKARKSPPPLADENVLQNEFFVVVLNPTSGGIQSISDYQSRGSRLGQQLALREPRGRKVYRDEWGSQREDPNFAYSLMAADEIAVTASTSAMGEITSRGRLMDREGELLARFVQTTRIQRGSRVLELNIELDPVRMPESDPWRNYYGVRFAWTDQTSKVYRSVSMASRPTEATYIEAPHFLEVRSGDLRTAILCGGLPYHRSNGTHMLDTLLVVHGETARKFRLGVGIDLPCPMPAALEFLAPRLTLSGVSAPSSKVGWLFHLDVRTVIATHWEPFVFEGHVTGFRVRLLETEGRRVAPRLRSFRGLQSARKLQPGETSPVELPIAGDRATVELHPYEWAEIECYW
jgi:alpha-mannosidase